MDTRLLNNLDSKTFFNSNTSSNKKEKRHENTVVAHAYGLTTLHNQESFSHKMEKQKKDDVYAKYPIRLLAYTNECGAALAPLIGPVGEMISNIPALAYIAMDVRDKYKRGDDESYTNPSKKRAAEQFTFQAFASVIFPTATVKVSQAVANKVIDSKFFEGVKKRLKQTAENRTGFMNFVNKFADAAPPLNPSMLTKVACQFQRGLEYLTVLPLMFSKKQQSSGLRNAGLAAVGLISLAIVIKPIDKFTEKIIINNIFKKGSEEKIQKNI